MGEIIFGPGKTSRQATQDHPVRRLWRDSERPAATHTSASIVQRRADIDRIQIHPRGQIVPASVREAVRSPGSPLDRATRQKMEPHFGDLSGVRVHTDARAAASADAIGAAAYTWKNDVVFAAGRYEHGTRTGHDLLAHELVHVAQQRGVSAGAVEEVSPLDHPLERNARSVLAGVAAPEPAPHAMLQRQAADEPLPPVSLSKPSARLGQPKERPSIMSGHLGFHLLDSDKQTLSDFLLSGHLEVGANLTPVFQGTPMSLGEVTDKARSLVLPIVPREEVSQFVTGKFLAALVNIRELPALPPMTFGLPGLAEPDTSGATGSKESASEWTAAAGGQWTYHMNSHSNPQSSGSIQVQFQHGTGAVVEVFQYQVDVKTGVAQPMGGLQFQASKSKTLAGVVLQGTAFLQLMAGLTQAPGSLSGDITFQVQGGVQGTATFGKISVALQVGLSLTLQDRQKPAWDTNVAPQAGGPDTFGMINTPGGGQVAGLTLRF